MIDRRRALMGVVKGRLPPEYQEVEWIGPDYDGTVASTNGKYRVRLENLTINQNTNMELKFETVVRKTSNVFINNRSIPNYGFDLGSSGSTAYRLHFYINKSTGKSIPAVLNGIYTVKIENQDCFIDNVKKYTFTDVEPFELNKMYVFDNLLAGSSQTAVVNIYYIKLYDDFVFLNLVPCYRKSDGVIGLYDLCGSICPLTNTPFYINEGTGTFIKGPDVL